MRLVLYLPRCPQTINLPFRTTKIQKETDKKLPKQRYNSVDVRKHDLSLNQTYIQIVRITTIILKSKNSDGIIFFFYSVIY